MTIYQFWGGLDTIGGNIVEVRTDNARIITDFGRSVSNEVTEQKPEEMSEIEFLLKTTQLPMLPELYDTTAFKELDLQSIHENSIETAVFISHLHLDHMGGLVFLPENTKVYLSKESYQLYQSLISVNEELEVSCTLVPVDFDEIIQVGDITVTLKSSDHDIMGISSIFVETPDLKLIHSGDFRLSGYHSERVLNWAKQAKEWGPDILLIEGTTFSFADDEKENKQSFSEQDLLENLTELLYKQEKELVVLNPYIRNVERLKYIQETVDKAGRVMVWEPNYAKVINNFFPELTLSVLGNNQKINLKAVSIDEISRNPGNYVLQNSYPFIDVLGEVGLESGFYLHSNGEPLGEYDPEFAILKEKVEQANFEFISFRSSGHATKSNLLKVAKIVDAKVTIPWHTFRPEEYAQEISNAGLKTMVPQKGVPYELNEAH